MQKRFEYNSNNSPGKNPFSTIITVIFFLVIVFLLFRLAAFVTQILTFLTPVLLIATVLIDYKVLTGYLVMLYNLIRKNALLGIGASILSVIGLPFVSVFLFSKAMLKRRVKKANEAVKQQKEKEFVSFEEVSGEPKEEKKEQPVLELKEPKKQNKKEGDYEKLFDDVEIEEDESEKNTSPWD